MDRKTLTAFILIGALFVGFDTFIFAPKRAAQKKKFAEWKKQKAAWDKQEAAKKKAAAGEDPQQDPANQDPKAKPTGDNKTEKAAPEAPVETIPAKTVTLSGKRFNVVLSNDGASLSSLTFNEIDRSDHKEKLRPIHEYNPRAKSLGLKLLGENPLDLQRRRWSVSESDKSVTFQTSPRQNQVVKKQITITDDYHVEVELTLTNNGAEPWKTQYALNGPAGFLEEYTARVEELQGAAVYKDKNGAFIFKNTGVSSVRGEEKSQTDYVVDHKIQSLAYVGLYSKYFASTLMPADDAARAAVDKARLKAMLSEAGEKVDENLAAEAKKSKHPSEAQINQMVAEAVTGELEIKPGQSVTHKYLLFCGPKGADVVYEKTYQSYGIHKLRDYGFGFFSLPARVMAGLLNILYSIFGNYGIAIIALTILVRLALHPLTRASQVNMFKMQKIGPEMQKIKAKYEGKNTPEARQKMSLETMELYRKHSVNPLAGCLPIFLQIPIFFSLYNVINYSYEIRHKAFFGWIKDLSVADYLFDLPFNLPFHGTTAFSLLPLLLMVLYFVNSNMQPKSQDPQQAEMQKMMKFVLPVFGYLFYTMPSGLVLYFITSMSGGVAETYYIRNILIPNMEANGDAPANEKKKSKKGK